MRLAHRITEFVGNLQGIEVLLPSKSPVEVNSFIPG